ncbi:hypothetical protein BWP39_16525 [Paraburkholderia acidicola]|uniref:Uncharacterized protein n=1 Tax=Paraburkholderia acidicola TaxID=1912599 RepID=A0A2A4F1A6_9BURK|nr:hypothetical protein BWP39_16525 [Paraburkholderia acidicola]
MHAIDAELRAFATADRPPVPHNGRRWESKPAVAHHRHARSDDHRRNAAWFGTGFAIKQRARDEAMKLVA